MNVKTDLWTVYKIYIYKFFRRQLYYYYYYYYYYYLNFTKVNEIMLLVCGQPVSYEKDIEAGFIQVSTYTLAYRYYSPVVTAIFIFLCNTLLKCKFFLQQTLLI